MTMIKAGPRPQGTAQQPAAPASEIDRHHQLAALAPAAEPMPAAWRQVIDFWLGVSPDAASMFLSAYRGGLRLEDLQSVEFEGPKMATGSYPMAVFDHPEAEFAVAHQGQVWTYRSFERGNGEPVELPGRVAQTATVRP